MKQPKRLTRYQKQVLTSHSLNPNEWMLLEETEFYFKIMNKKTNIPKMVDKFMRKGKK